MEEEDLEAALVGFLTQRGVLKKMQMTLKTEILSALKGDQPLHDTTKEKEQPPPREILILNELVREYLEFANYTHTRKMLDIESEPAARLSRELVKAHLKVEDHHHHNGGSQQVPLLYALIFGGRAGN
jgi:lisH domain-containing protein FOPNL